jgi:uncharacterized membrane protein YqaE (UPF0057 family)
MRPGLIVAALLLPPLAIFLDEGVTRNFWITFALTCFGLIPGVIYAFVVLLRKVPEAPARTSQPA